jgi:hypothetical protein
LIIDHDGLRKLERLPERPDFSQQRFDNQAFVVEDESFFGAPAAKFEVVIPQSAIPWTKAGCGR